MKVLFVLLLSLLGHRRLLSAQPEFGSSLEYASA